MKIDPSEPMRRELVAELNAKAAERITLEAEHDQVWNTEELGRDFEVKGFMAPFAIVVRKADRVRGTVMFQHSPRYYFEFKPE